ncbi:hypothetical protein DFH08DRAFT_935700 [Mycena albidolilacea]|uniref:Uncharacterized protein n=1 Tax=Mycena albidolilacea TaxID=1033008 RepID=A0AAD7ETG6_9AGAR|nr:hypothetical protein DFH08DRAFT_935700 [Mycena albidolilacea]
MAKARLTKAQKDQRLAARKNSPLGSSSLVNSDPPDVQTPPTYPSPKTRKASTISLLNDQISTLKTSLETSADESRRLASTAADLEASNQAQAGLLDQLYETTESLRSALTLSQSAHLDCSSRLSATLSELSFKRDAFQTCCKRVKRLENDKKKIQLAKRKDARTSAQNLSGLQSGFDTQSCLVSSLSANINLLEDRLRRHAETAAATLKKVRAERKAYKMQAQRAQRSLSEARHDLEELSTWSAKKGHMYSMETRRLVLRICGAGCAESKVRDIVLWCAEVFRIRVTHFTLTARTVGCIKREGGYISLIQIGREIKMMYGFTESSDGTSHRKTSLECRSLSGMLPTYEPGVDDTNPSTWRPRTRFLEVAPSLSHTAQAQVDGTTFLASKIATALTKSPSAIAEGLEMDWKDWFRKQLAQMSDHANDQKLKHEISSEVKHDIVIEDLGVQESETLSLAELMDALLAISEEEVEELGDDTYNSLSDDLQILADFLIFAGCCGHKETNTFKGGCKAMSGAWPEGGEPVLLANKANDTTIRLGKKDSAAVRAAEDASTRGIVKATTLLGALLRNKDEDKGYQDKYTIFMEAELFDLCGETDVKRFPATSQTRYGSHGRAAAVVTKHYPMLIKLIDSVCDGKTKAGANHVEESVLKALNCPRTMAEIVSAALYSACIAWPYMQTVRQRDENGMLPNLIDLVDIHRKAPELCQSLAATPALFLDPDTAESSSHLTLDGKPIHDVNILLAAQALSPDLPDLQRMITAMFSGAGDTWLRFTPEFAVGGPIDSIPLEIRAKIYIPSTMITMKAVLVHIASTFAITPTRYKRNNTEAFARKYITAEDLLHVMREVRKEDSSGASAAFRKGVVEELEKKAQAYHEKVRASGEKKTKREATLRAVGVEQDRAVITQMTVVQLKAQYDVYKVVVKDPIILKTTLTSIPRCADKLAVVLAALTRYESLSLPNGSPVVDASPAVESGNIPDESAEIPDRDSDVDNEMEAVRQDEFAGEAEEEELYH